MSTDHKLTTGPHSLAFLRGARQAAVELLQRIEGLVDDWDARSDDERDLGLAQADQLLADVEACLDEATNEAIPAPDDGLPEGRHFSTDEVRRASRSWPPPAEVAERLQAALDVADEVRERCGFALTIRSAWRPADGDSMHRFGAALDLDVTEPTPERTDKLRMVGTTMWHEGKINGLGIYRRPKARIHIDVPAPGGKGHRFWHVDESQPYRRRHRDGERA